MKVILYLIVVVFFLSSLLLYSQKYNKEYCYPYADGIPAEVFKERRSELLSRFTDKSLLLFLSADHFITLRNHNSSSLISPDLYYLTGMPPQISALLLIPGGYFFGDLLVFEILFIENQSDEDILWNGINMSKKDVEEILDIHTVCDISILDSIACEILESKDTLYFDRIVSLGHFINFQTGSSCEIDLLSNIRSHYPELSILNHIRYINSMRAVKDEHEIRLIQKAVDISISGHKASMKLARPGIMEYRLQAEMEYQFRKSGSEKPAYASIVGGGMNSCFLHYHSNRDAIKDGDLVLMDCGADYHGYASDITRTFPVNGRFSPEQKIIYNIVLEAMDSAFTACKPGGAFKLIHQKANEVIKYRLKQQGIIRADKEIEKYFPHSTSHFLGLDVHDPCISDTLQAGNVLTVEPGIYISEGSPCDRRWWNIGVRIEDDILITKTGYRNMSEKLPRKPEEIEELMR
jgi:Xaa-Pro aminopeptidase